MSQMFGWGMRLGGTGGTSTTPPPSTPSLDFSVANNSQYAPVLTMGF